METTKQLYERAKAASGCKTAYEFAKRHGVTRQLVSNWANSKNSFDDEHADLIANLLRLEPGYVMACAHAERSKSKKASSNWARLAALAMAAGISTGSSAAMNRLPQFDNNSTLYKLCAPARRRISPRQYAMMA